MTSPAANPARRALRALALVTVVATTLAAAPAVAGTPDTWDDTTTSVLGTVMLFVVFPVLLFGLIFVLSSVPHWRRQHRESQEAGLVKASPADEVATSDHA